MSAFLKHFIIFPNTKVAHFTKFNQKNPVNFKLTSATFATSLFALKKQNLSIFLIIKNLKGYEILVVKFIQNLLIDLIKQLFDLFKRKGLF